MRRGVNVEERLGVVIMLAGVDLPESSALSLVLRRDVYDLAKSLAVSVLPFAMESEGDQAIQKQAMQALDVM